MASKPLENVLAYIRTLVRESAAKQETDGELLDLFIAHRDYAAFTALVSRYAPLVYGVCQRILGDRHEAEDAFQATFLVLLQKVASVRNRKALGAWLYTVAYHIAIKARIESARQVPISLREEQAMVSEDPTAEAVRQEVRSVVDEEINRLPRKYRLPLIYCYLQGKTNREAACELGWPAGSMSRRLVRGKELLRRRLTRRGLTVSSAVLTAVLTEKVAAMVPATLVTSTVGGAVLVAAGETTADAIKAAVHLAHGLLVPAYVAKIKLVTAVLLAASLFGGGGFVLYWTRVPPGTDTVSAYGSPPPAPPVQPEKAKETTQEVEPPQLYASGEAMLNLAYVQQSKGNHWEAIEAFRRVLKRFPTGEYADRAMVGIASSQVALKDRDAAVRTYQGLISRYANDGPFEVYIAANQLITLADQLKKPGLKVIAYQAILRTCKGSSNRSGRHLDLIAYYLSRKNEDEVKKHIEAMFRDCAGEPSFRAHVKTLLGRLDDSPPMKPLAEEVRQRLENLPATDDADAATYKEYQDLATSKNYKEAVAKAEALAKASPQGYYTPLALQNAASLAENQLKDIRKARDLCKLWVLSMRGEDEGDNLRQALSSWAHACLLLKDGAGAGEVADYALTKFPYCSATDDILLNAVKVRCQDGNFWTNNQALTEALTWLHTILEKYPHGSAALEAKWVEKRVEKVVKLNEGEQ